MEFYLFFADLTTEAFCTGDFWANLGQMPILTFRGEARCKKLGPSEMPPALFHRQPPKKPPISGEMRPIPTQGVS